MKIAAYEPTRTEEAAPVKTAAVPDAVPEGAVRVEGAIGDPVAPEADPVSEPNVAVANPVEPIAVFVLTAVVTTQEQEES